MSTRKRTATRYTVRTFESDDRSAFLSLYESVFGHQRNADWFRWKFSENPYVDHVPILVAIEDGVPVGFRSFSPRRCASAGSSGPRSSPAIRWFTRIIAGAACSVA